MDNLPYLEIYLTSASFFLIIVYHIQLIHQIRTRPLTTSIGVTNHLRGHWVESIMEHNRDLLAVQTLRNWVMASSFLASRYYNHVNFMINVPSTLAHKITPEYITGILNRGMMHYSLGMRGYYLGVLLVLWLFGPIWMLMGTVVMLIALYHLDRTA